MIHHRHGLSTAIAVSSLVLATAVLADPPVPGDDGTICSTVQCMKVTSSVDNGNGSFDVTFQTYNWFNTINDEGVNRILFFTGNLKSKTCDGELNVDAQVEVLGATPPPGWLVVQADDDKVEFAATSNTFEIPDIGLCDPLVNPGNCFPTDSCGNSLSGFVITLRPELPTGDLCSWTANWRHLNEAGLDNGDVMNFGSVSWTFGSIVEDYSNQEYPPSSFSQNGVDDCAKQAQKKAAKYAQTRLKQFSKCNDKINKGKPCDTAKRDQKVNDAKVKMDTAIDTFCTSNDQVANVAWCGTTIANLKTCLLSQLNASTDAALANIYGP